MNNILDHEEDTASEIQYADKAFIYFKWMAIFFTATLMTSYFQRTRDISSDLASPLILLFLFIALVLAFPCLNLAIKSYKNRESISYKNMIPGLASIGMLLFFLFVIMVNLYDILSFFQ